MSLENLSVLVDGTVATTGGTATTLKSKGSTIAQHDLYLDDGSILLSQTEIAATVKNPKVSASAPNGYTQARNAMMIKVPLALENLNSTVNTIKVDTATDVETTDDEKLSMRVLMAQMLVDPDLADFWNNQGVG